MPMDPYPAPVPPTNQSTAKTREAIIPVRARVRDGKIVSLLDQAGNEMGLPVTATPSDTGAVFDLGGTKVFSPTSSDPIYQQKTVGGEETIHRHDGTNYARITPVGSNFWVPQPYGKTCYCLTDHFFSGSVDMAEILPDGTIIPGDNILTVIPIYGQSLALGSRGFAEDASGVKFGTILHPNATDYPEHVLAFGDVGAPVSYPRIGNYYLDLRPLAEKFDGSVLGESAAWTLGQRRNNVVSAAALKRQRLLIPVGGLGGTAYAGLAKGTGPYTQMMNAIAGAKALATARGWKMYVPHILIVHGESESNTTAAQYRDFLAQWQSDFDADIKAITAQKQAVGLVVSQTNRQKTTTRGAPLGALLAHKANANISLVGPKYQERYYDDAHMLGAGYSHLGDLADRTMQHLAAGRKWEPLRPTAVLQAANQITLKFNNQVAGGLTVAGPVGALAFDTSRVTDPGNYGFVGVGANVTAVALGGDGTSVVLTLDASPRTGALIEYAMQDALNLNTMPPGQNTGSRGCLRDSDTRAVHTYDGLPMHNYCVAFSENPDVAAAADLDAVTGITYWPLMDSLHGTANGFSDRKTGSSDVTNGFANPATRLFETTNGVSKDWCYTIANATHALLNASFDTSGSFTVGIVGKPTTLSARGGLTFGSINSANQWFVTDTVNSADGKLKMHFNGTESAYADYTGPVLTAETWMAVVLVFDRAAGTAKLRCTTVGGSTYEQTLTGLGSKVLANELCIGGNTSTGTLDYRAGRYRGAVGFSRALSGADLAKLEAYLLALTAIAA